MLRSEVRRQLATSAETLVIVDSLNYARSKSFNIKLFNLTLPCIF